MLAGAGCTRENLDYVDPAFELSDGSVPPDLLGLDLTGVDLRHVVAPPVDLAGVDLAVLPPDLQLFVGCGDGVCSGGETCASCQTDCGGCNACPDGFADCNGIGDDGCETDIRSVAHCGGCNNACLAAGGTTRCLAKGDTYVCQPTCDATHASCDNNPTNGCETSLADAASCGACNVVCGGGATCTAGASSFGCVTPCDSMHASCDGNASNGCETYIDDSGETSNNNCGSQQDFGDIDEGIMDTITAERIFPANDVDLFKVRFVEAAHSGCTFLATQAYTGWARVTPPAGVHLAVKVGPYDGTCTNSWSGSTSGTCVPLGWTGTCGFTDQPTVSFQVISTDGTSSCYPYTLEIAYCALGMSCIPPGCN